MKLAVFLLLIDVPTLAQPVLEHAHRIGDTVVYLTESGDGQASGTFYVDSSGRITVAATPLLAAMRGMQTNVSPRPCVAFETWAEHKSSDYVESSQAGFTSVERTGAKTVAHRFFRGDYSRVYVSYTVTVETLPEGTYRVVLGPSTVEPPAQLRAKADWKFQSPTKFPVPQVLSDAHAIRLELYLNGTSRRVVDYVHAGQLDRMVGRTDAPHSYYADDAEFTVTQPSLRINGVAQEVLAPPGTLHGPVLMVYVPGHGRYVLTLHPSSESGFENAGEVAGKSLTFDSEGNIFRIDTAERIAAGSGDYAVHVLPDLGWEPPGPRDREKALIGAVPYVEPVEEK